MKKLHNEEFLNSLDLHYHQLLQEIKDHGIQKGDRTGTGTLSLFGHQMRFDLSLGIPLLTTKKVFLRSIIHELLWLISGDTNIKYLKDNKVGIWDDWADKNGDLGPVYGAQWRNWNGDEIDQIKNAINDLKTNPNSRRILISAWNPSVMPDTSVSFDENVANGKAALPPCHAFVQFWVGDGKLSCQMYQRSGDVFLGVPFNIASYAIFTMMMAQVCDLGLGDFIHSFGDVHIYNNHVEQVELQLSRNSKGGIAQLELNPNIKNIDDFTFEDFTITNYDPHPYIKAPISV